VLLSPSLFFFFLDTGQGTVSLCSGTPVLSEGGEEIDDVGMVTVVGGGKRRVGECLLDGGTVKQVESDEMSDKGP